MQVFENSSGLGVGHGLRAVDRRGPGVICLAERTPQRRMNTAGQVKGIRNAGTPLHS